jgi:HlyD family secretion protein
MKKLMIGIVVLVIVAGGTYAIFGRGGAGANASPAASEAAPTLPAVKAGNQVLAEAQVVPVQYVALSLPTGGIVAEVHMAEGDRVQADQVLVRLDAAQQAAAVAQARANLTAAEAQLARVQAGPDDEEITAAEAAVEVAQAGVQTAEGAVASARANLARAQAGAAQEEIAIAQRQVERAKNTLWGAQNQRDSICGQVGSGARQSDCDGARARVQEAEEEVRIAELQLQQTQRGPRREDVAIAQAQLQEALGRLATAQAQVRQAEANLAQVKKGPSAEDVATARAEVDQARAALEKAQVALDETELRAPFAGTVASLDLKVGEQVAAGTPIVRLADLSTWQIETDDLTELGVVGISQGDPAKITFDAIPDLELSGKVTRVKIIGENKRGDMTYTVIVTPDQQDARLRWNMTASVSIEPD